MNRKIAILLCLALLGGLVTGLMTGVAARRSIPQPAGLPPRPIQDITSPEVPWIVTPPATTSPATNITNWSNLLAAVKIDIPPPVRGDGVIKGRVLSDAGEAIPGVRIKVVPNNIPWHTLPSSHTRSNRSGQDIDPEAMVRSIVQRHKLQAAYNRETLTDSNGVYQVDGLERTGHNVSASLASYLISPQGGSGAFNIIPDAEINFTASPVYGLACHVINPDGTRAETATVRWEKDGTQSASAWSSAQPRLEWAPGTYVMRAQGGTRGEWESDSITVAIGPGSTLPLTFVLKETPGIRGRIVFDGGFTPRSVQVCARLLNDGGFPDAAALAGSPLRAWPTSFDGYRFIIQNAAPGRYAIAALDNRRQRLLASDIVTVQDRLTDCELRVSMPARGDYVLARVSGPDGQFLPALSFLTSSRPDKGTAPDEYSWGRLPDGLWWILHPSEADGQPVTSCWLTVQSAEYGTKTVEYSRTAASEVAVSFEPAGTLTVLVSGHPADSITARLELELMPPGRRDSIATLPSTADGPVVFRGLATGEYVLRLTSKCKRTPWPLASQSANVRPGDNVASIQVPPLYPLRVSAPDPAFGENIHLTLKDTRNGWISEYTKLDPSTRQVSFDGLPAGDYAVKMLHAERTGRIDITLPGTSDVLFDPPPLNALEVNIKDAGGYLTQAGFQTGDLIIAVNGVPFRKIDTIAQVLDGYKGMKDVTLTIMRGNRFVDVKVDVDKLHPGGNDGWLSSQSVRWE